MTRMRWNCVKKDCWLQHRSDIEMFDGCFPFGVSASDLDGIVELNGRFLVVEFKTPGKRVDTGQRLLRERLVNLRVFTVVVVESVGQNVTGWIAYSDEYLGGVAFAGDIRNLREFVWNWTKGVAPERAPGRLARYRHWSIEERVV